MAEIVRRKREFRIKGLKFCALRKKVKKALKASWVALRRENVETGRYNSPMVYRKLSMA